MKSDFRKAQSCEKEQAVGIALRNGTIPPDLLPHIGSCAVCTDVVTVSEFLLQSVASEKIHVPDAALAFRRAQLAARQQAVAKATRPIRIAQFSAGVAGVLALPWFWHIFLNSPFLIPFLAHFSWRMDRSLSDALTGIALFSIVGSLLLISVSSWYVLRQE